MKNKILSILMALNIFVASNIVTSQNSHALVGFIFKSKVVKVIGGIGAGAGASLFTVGFVAGSTASNVGTLIWSVFAMVYGPAIAGVGLIILDDNTVVDLEFQEINSESEDFRDYTSLEIETYNAELEELNAIRKTIQLEVADDAKTIDDAADLWKYYSEVLSPATIKIAEAKAAKFIEEINKSNR